MGLVLRKSLTKMPLNKEEVDSFFDATDQLSSNTEHSSVLIKMAELPGLNKYACTGLLESASNLSSNTNKSRVLRAVAKTKLVEDKDIRSTYLEVARTLSSDTEYRRVMEALNK